MITNVKRLKYVILSDLHLGSGVCQHIKLISLLKNINTETLVLNGDIIDIDHLKRLSKKDWKILSLLRKLSKNTHIVYIRGNHDSKIADIISDLLGFEFKNNYDFICNEKKFHILHGDEFDSFITNFPLITEIATGIYYYIQLLSPKKQELARVLKRRSKNFIKSCEMTKRKAEALAKEKGYDYIVAGHCHSAFFSPNSPYINSGCFTELDCSYIEISDDNIRLKYI